MMKFVVLFCLSFTLLWAGDIKPEHVAIIYNTKVPHSRELADLYAQTRNVPKENIIPLVCSSEESISRQAFEDEILFPLQRTARTKLWWRKSGIQSCPMTDRKIHVLLLMSGMPLKIQEDPSLFAEGQQPSGTTTTAASVDSELMLLAFDQVEKKGMLGNPYYNKEEKFAEQSYPIFLVSRIDAPSVETCKRMITQPSQVEKSGLWGWLLVDQGGPYPEGDGWLSQVALLGQKNGFPLIWDKTAGLLPSHLPLPSETAYYVGWYTGDLNSPFSDPEFRFIPGAIAMHIHSFSASTLRNERKGWSGPLLEKGADVTVGNVNEPFLGPTHHYDIFFDRLLKGYSVVEAGMMSLPTMSWQCILLGDPLYRPFKHRVNKTLHKTEKDKWYQAWWLACDEFVCGSDKWHAKLNQVAETSPIPIISEALGHYYLQLEKHAEAKKMLNQAHQKATNQSDSVRMGWYFGSALRHTDGIAVYKKFIENMSKKFSSGQGSQLLKNELNTLNKSN